MALCRDEMKRRLQKALDRGGGTHTIEDVVAGVKAGTMQAFWSDDALIVTEIAQTPRKKWLNIFLAAGKMDDVFALTPQLEAFAEKEGCDFAAMTGRKGWAGVLSKKGWHQRGVSYARPVRSEAHG